MNFDFQQMKKIMQQEFDSVLESYPTELSAVEAEVPFDPDPFVRKRALFQAVLKHCNIHIFPHYPFAFEIDCGQIRDLCHNGIGRLSREKSGTDFEPLSAFRRIIGQNALGTFNDFTDYLHRTLDHDLLLKRGFRGVYEECIRLNVSETDADKRKWRELVMELCLIVRRIGEKFQERAFRLLEEKNLDEDARYNLQRMTSSVNTPWEAPVTFFDALTCILRTALIISGFDDVEMNCYGQLDRLLIPYYERDIANGILTEDEADFLIQSFLFKTDCHAHFNEERTNYDNGVSVMIGGCDENGNLVYNKLTELILKAYQRNRFINPKLNARASVNSPKEYLLQLTGLMYTGNNNLVIENDDYVVPMFLRMGIRPEDARRYAGNGCQEVICPNQVHSRAFTYLNMVKVLLDTLDGSREKMQDDLKMIYQYGCFRTDTFEDLYQSFLQNLRSYIRVIAEQFAPYEQIEDRISLHPLLSAFTGDCVAEGRDLTMGGARYSHKTLALVGFGTLCDSLLSLKRSYESGTQETLLSAMKKDYQGYEVLQKELWNSEDKFGHSESADAFARNLAEDLSNVSKGIYNARGVEWHTSLFTYYFFEWDGKKTGATPDGRKAGQTFSRQTNMAILPDLTDAARSMSLLAEVPFDDVGIFDLSLPLTVSDTENVRETFTDYIRTCLSLKIPVLQVNISNKKELEEERAKKGTHPDLVVRVCGYSAVFSQLDNDMQDEIIARS